MAALAAKVRVASAERHLLESLKGIDSVPGLVARNWEVCLCVVFILPCLLLVDSHDFANVAARVTAVIGGLLRDCLTNYGLGVRKVD
ncbi:hypothetical protein Mag101_10975 [Microbulbifer agarilyticus]|uniref:Uncharacterized protein n=1 Tax=Microbulbifer agarilyticus TaxID=260552 RepID=A0A1Q2M624_9GAMM|nr:hypothetical protein Mag101_10975 [Microbulbifer agarilyticus]